DTCIAYDPRCWVVGPAASAGAQRVAVLPSDSVELSHARLPRSPTSPDIGRWVDLGSIPGFQTSSQRDAATDEFSSHRPTILAVPLPPYQARGRAPCC